MLKARSRSASDVGWWLQEDLEALWARAVNDDEVDWNEPLQSFLLQIESCGDILKTLPHICERVLKMKIETTSQSNSQNPRKAVEIRSSTNKVYYLSTFVNGEDCNCAIKFGGESWKDSMENAVRAANSTSEGCQLQTFVVNHLLSDQTSWYSKERSASTFTLERLFFFVLLSEISCV